MLQEYFKDSKSVPNDVSKECTQLVEDLVFMNTTTSEKESNVFCVAVELPVGQTDFEKGEPEYKEFRNNWKACEPRMEKLCKKYRGKWFSFELVAGKEVCLVDENLDDLIDKLPGDTEVVCFGCKDWDQRIVFMKKKLNFLTEKPKLYDPVRISKF